MSKSDDYIIITGSRNLDEGSSNSDATVHEEREDASLRALEGQGISILDKEARQATNTDDKPRDQFSRELMDEGGIEIVSANEEEESFL